MFFKRLLTYLNPLTLFKKGEGDFNLKMMHGINRISIFVFLICIVLMLIKYFGS